ELRGATPGTVRRLVFQPHPLPLQGRGPGPAEGELDRAAPAVLQGAGDDRGDRRRRVGRGLADPTLPVGRAAALAGEKTGDFRLQRLGRLRGLRTLARKV